MTAKEFLAELREEGFDWVQIRAALEDGETLARLGINDQEMVEEAYELVAKEINQ